MTYVKQNTHTIIRVKLNTLIVGNSERSIFEERRKKMKKTGDKAKCCFCGKKGKVTIPCKEVVFLDNSIGKYYPGYGRELYICKECESEKEIFKNNILNLVDILVKEG